MTKGIEPKRLPVSLTDRNGNRDYCRTAMSATLKGLGRLPSARKAVGSFFAAFSAKASVAATRAPLLPKAASAAAREPARIPDPDAEIRRGIEAGATISRPSPCA